MSESEIRLTRLASCAGCGAKVGAGVLAQLLDGIKVHRDPSLLVGFDKSDDASVYRLSEELALVQTVDFFPPIADDPYTFGQIAAANALSDVYAMGGEPKLCLNILCVPENMPRQAVHDLLRGGYDKVYEAGALITAGKAELLSPAGQALALKLMTTLNRGARDCMVKYRVHACTDVTGFGLLGHACEMAQGSDVSLTLRPGDMDLLPEAAALAREGILPEGMYRNRAFAEREVDPGDTPLWQQDMLYDPQTSGGLLIAVDPLDADALLSELAQTVPSAQRIGRAEAYAGGPRIRLR